MDASAWPHEMRPGWHPVVWGGGLMDSMRLPAPLPASQAPPANARIAKKACSSCLPP